MYIFYQSNCSILCEDILQNFTYGARHQLNQMFMPLQLIANNIDVITRKNKEILSDIRIQLEKCYSIAYFIPYYFKF